MSKTGKASGPSRGGSQRSGPEDEVRRKIDGLLEIAGEIAANYRTSLKVAWIAYAETLNPAPKPEDAGIIRGPSRDPAADEALAWAAYDAILAPATSAYVAAMRELGSQIGRVG